MAKITCYLVLEAVFRSWITKCCRMNNILSHLLNRQVNVLAVDRGNLSPFCFSKLVCGDSIRYSSILMRVFYQSNCEVKELADKIMRVELITQEIWNVNEICKTDFHCSIIESRPNTRMSVYLLYDKIRENFTQTSIQRLQRNVHCHLRQELGLIFNLLVDASVLLHSKDHLEEWLLLCLCNRQVKENKNILNGCIIYCIFTIQVMYSFMVNRMLAANYQRCCCCGSYFNQYKYYF